MLPTIGRTVKYTLTEVDATRINKRRNDFIEARLISVDDTGFIGHNGNIVEAGETYPLVITRVWGNGLINGQVLLDGNDVLWVTSVTEGDEVGTFSWPTRN